MDTTILPPGRLQEGHTYPQFLSHEANRYIFRVHRQYGRGRLIPGIGFVARAYDKDPETAVNVRHHESRNELSADASAHITQWNDGTYSSLQSQFISASFSLAYALFEGHRWDDLFRCQSTQISVIDPTKIPGDAWLATELIGVEGSPANRAPRFARWAQEVLVYVNIPDEAVVFTAPVETYYHTLLPEWCDPVTDLIASRTLKSTEAVVDALGDVARSCTAERERKLVDYVVEKCVEAFDQGTFNKHNNSPHNVVWLAALFCWWPKRMRRVHPREFAELKDLVRRKVESQLKIEVTVFAQAATPEPMEKVIVPPNAYGELVESYDDQHESSCSGRCVAM
ncbi:hypothetical protein MIND_00366300 [Mycena indigotica]|uniref:DUF7587 domain-containing protein n=1 Tax=Mycena indigotica TaxID=2126181 RepID=A0A8H6T2T7_9AGAR|nr:uncharacterized protein MIND_00366300 [Mycena indigotica]KAF7309938.1 hypothetical protein MIND_00366300 [Mycena indigotica]